MQKAPKVTLEQWRVLLAVVDYGGFAQAAEALHKSQSSISYTVAKLQEQLGYPLLAIEGRKAQLTGKGRILIKRARQLLNEASELDTLIQTLGKDWEPKIELIVDSAFPTAPLLKALQQFQLQSRGTLIQLRNTTYSSSSEEIPTLLIGSQIPLNESADFLLEVSFLAVASPNHSLFDQSTNIANEPLTEALHIVVENTSIDDKHHSSPSPKHSTEQNWCVPNTQSAIEMVTRGMGYAWLPISEIKDQLEEGKLKALPLISGNKKSLSLFAMFEAKKNAGPATQCFLDLLKNECLKTIAL